MTTLILEPPELVEKIYLIRSYTSRKRTTTWDPDISSRRATGRTIQSNTTGTQSNNPARRNTDTLKSRVTNHGEASNFQIWQVARAATAAPFYFKPLKVNKPNSDTYMIFKDGGFGSENNPTKEGFREISYAYGPASVGAVVSIGTARDDTQINRKGITRKVTNIMNRGNDPETVHKDMEEEASKERFPYFRLNAPYDKRLKMPLDEWEPKGPFHENSGTETLNSIRNKFNEWAGEPAHVRELQDCAKELVNRRRARLKDLARWERYATGARFSCRKEACDMKSELRDEFKHHVITRHKYSPGEDLDFYVDRCKSEWKYQPKH